MFYMFFIHKADEGEKQVRISQLNGFDYDEDWFKQYMSSYDPQRMNITLANDPKNHPDSQVRIVCCSNNEYIKEFHTQIIDILLLLGDQLGLEIVK